MANEKISQMPSGAPAQSTDMVPIARSGNTNNLSLEISDITTAVLGTGAQNEVLATPNGSSGAVSLRALVAADIPTLNQNTTGTAANLSGTPALPNGTTATTQTAGDSSTKLATDQFVSTAIGALASPQLVQSGLIAQYNMTDAGGSDGVTLTDSSSNGNNGYLGDRAVITNLSLTSNVITITANNDFVAAQVVKLTGLTTNPSLNGTSLTVISTGLSSTQFEANLTHANIPSAAETGNATVTATVPTFIANTGGLSFAAASSQRAVLPSAINAMKTVMLVTFFDPNASGVQSFGCPLAQAGASPNAPQIMYTANQRSASISGSSYYCAQGYTGSFVARGAGPVAGYMVLTLSQQGGGDHFYYYTVDQGSGTTLGSVATNWWLGGNSGGTRFFQGQIVFAAFWNVALTTAQVAQNVAAVQQLLQARGLVLNGTPAGNTWQTPDNVDTVVLDGDSEVSFLLAANFPTIGAGASFNVFNNSQSGQTAEFIANSAMTSVDPFLPNSGGQGGVGTTGAGANRAGVITFIGTNDSGGAATIPLGTLAKYCRDRKKAGWNKVFVATMLSRTGADTFKNSYNTLIRQYWSNWADGMIDNGACPVFGADGANANTSYFSSGLHWSTTISEQMSGRMWSYALRRMYGNTEYGVPNSAVATPYLMQPEDIFLTVNQAGANDIYLIPAQFFTGQKIYIRNIGAGTATLHSKPVSATITNLVLTSNVITITAANNFTAGDVVVLSGLTTNPTLNGTSLIVSSTGLSSSSFQAALTHANIGSAAETGTAFDANYCQIGANTNVSETAGNVVTLTVSNNFANGSSIQLSGLTTATWLNGHTVTLTSASSTQIQFTDPTAHGAQASTAETGISLFAYAAETINGSATATVAGGATCVLLSQLSASSTGLANWITLQNS